MKHPDHVARLVGQHRSIACDGMGYVLLACVFVYEGNYAKCTYWIGAAIITGSVLVMK